MERGTAWCALRLLVSYSTVAFLSPDGKMTSSLSLQGSVGGNSTRHRAVRTKLERASEFLDSALWLTPHQIGRSTFRVGHHLPFTFSFYLAGMFQVGEVGMEKLNT